MRRELGEVEAEGRTISKIRSAGKDLTRRNFEETYSSSLTLPSLNSLFFSILSTRPISSTSTLSSPSSVSRPSSHLAPSLRPLCLALFPASRLPYHPARPAARFPIVARPSLKPPPVPIPELRVLPRPAPSPPLSVLMLPADFAPRRMPTTLIVLEESDLESSRCLALQDSSEKAASSCSEGRRQTGGRKYEFASKRAPRSAGVGGWNGCMKGSEYWRGVNGGLEEEEEVGV